MARSVYEALAADQNVRRALQQVYGSDSPEVVRKAMTSPTSEIAKFGFSQQAEQGATARTAPQAKPQGTAPVASPNTPKKQKTLAPKQKVVKPVPPKDPYQLDKSDSVDVEVETEFSKVDDEQRTVFGWASIVKMDGKPVVDRQGDYIDIEELSKSAYDYVVSSRKGGHQHKRTETGDPLHVSDMIESVVLTPEKIEKMGLPPETPQGWWVGYKVRDDEIWDAVKKGEVTGFSVHGKGRRHPMTEMEITATGLDT